MLQTVARYRSLDIEDKECHPGGCWDVSVSGKKAICLFPANVCLSLYNKFLRLWEISLICCCIIVKANYHFCQKKSSVDWYCYGRSCLSYYENPLAAIINQLGWCEEFLYNTSFFMDLRLFSFGNFFMWKLLIHFEENNLS